jgi:hypothetical protein
MAAKGFADGLAGLQIPTAYSAVPTAGDHDAVRHGDGGNTLLIAAWGFPNRLARIQIPPAHGFVLTAGD